MNFDSVFERHKNIALQLSGGKDSLAVLHVMKRYWDRLTVYWLNSGNAFPETIEQMARIKSEVPHFVEIEGKQPQTLKQFGWPSDVVPVNASPLGQLIEHSGIRLNDRYFCCFKSIMEPMQQQMIADKITLIIRGQKQTDKTRGPLKSGEVAGPWEVLYPIEHWTDEQVLQYLTYNDIEIPRFYKEGMTSAPDCFNCTAWLEHGQAAYMRKHHAEGYKELRNRLNTIAVTIEPYVDRLKEFK